MSAIIEKSLNNDLAGIVGNQFIKLNMNKIDNAYNSNYVIHRCVNILAENGASLPMRLYRGDELMPEGFIIPQHGGFNIDQPHPNMSMNELLYEGLVYKYYRGEFMIFIDMDGRLTLEPINPKLMKVKIKDRFGNIETWRWNRKLDISVDELIYDKIFNPDDIRGTSLVDVIKEELINDNRAREFNTKFFENFARIGGTLHDDKGQATSKQMEDLVTQFNQAHSGSEEAYKTLGLPEGIKYQEFAQTMNEMQFRESRGDIRDRILSLFGVHKALIGVTDSVDRAVADAAKASLWNETLRPTMLGVQEKFNQCLFKRYFPGYKCKFDFNEVSALQKDKTEIMNRAKIYHELGYSTNEINELLSLGMEDIDDLVGDMRFVPQSLIPVDELTLEPAEETPAKSIDKLDKVVDILDKEETKARRNHTYKNKYNRIRLNIEKQMFGKLGNFFSKQLGKVLSIIKSKKSIEKTSELEVLTPIMMLLQEEKDVLVGIMKPLYENGSLTASKLALDTLGVDKQPRISSYIVDQMSNKIGGINSYTYKLIRKQVKESIAAGESINKMAKRITNVYKFNKSRSRTIARTESGKLVQGTTHEEYIKGGVEKHQWVGGQRESHAAQDGEVVAMGKAFKNGQLYACDGTMGAGENVNCRCTNAPII